MSMDGWADGRTHYFSPLQLTSGDNKGSQDKKSQLYVKASTTDRNGGQSFAIH